jgi:hypothetical protein
VREFARPSLPWRVDSLGLRETQLEDLISPKINDNSAGRYLRVLAAGLQSGLTPPSRAWFTLRVPDDDLMEYGPVKEWLYLVQMRVYNEFARSGFYPAIHSVYGDLAAYCSGCLAATLQHGTGVSFSDIPTGVFALDGNSRGEVHTLARFLSLSAGELAACYGLENVSSAVKADAEKQPWKPVNLAHIVMPRPYAERQPGKIDRLHKPFAVYLYEVDGLNIVHEGGMDNFPYLCARWDLMGGELYGRGVGFDNLPDVRMLQAVSKDQAMAIRMAVTPPMQLPASMKGAPLYLLPGAKNYVLDSQYEKVKPMYDIKADIPAASAKIVDLRQALREGFFNDLFLMLNNTVKDMTAYEVAERNAEKLLILGPVIERHQTDILDPVISLTFNFLDSMGAFPPAPPEIQGLGMEIQFISVLAQAQKLSQATAIRKVAADIAGLAELYPEARDKFDPDQAIDELALIEGVPPKVIRTDDIVAAIREQRALAAVQAAQMQQAAAMSQGLQDMKTLGETKTGPDTALGDILQSMGVKEKGNVNA